MISKRDLQRQIERLQMGQCFYIKDENNCFGRIKIQEVIGLILNHLNLELLNIPNKIILKTKEKEKHR